LLLQKVCEMVTTVVDSVGTVYNPFEPGFHEDPYDQYARIRSAGRTQRSLFDNLVVHRYDDCFGILRRAGTSVDDAHANAPVRRTLPPDLLARLDGRGRRAMLMLDPPDHTRIRRLVASAFTVRSVDQLRPRVQAIADGLLDRIAASSAAAGGGSGSGSGSGSEPVDLMSDFAFPLPFQVITELLGMPEGDRDRLRELSHTITLSLEPVLDDATLRATVAASDEMHQHILDAIAWKRRHPADDLLSAMIAAEEDGERLSTAELRDQVSLLYLAGHETTVNLIGNGTLALLRHRDQMERLVADPGLDAGAVDELLRWDSPVQLSRRIVLEELEVAGETVRPGDVVMTLLGAANRDPDHWGPTAERLDLGRPGAGAHLSFGSGIHHCLGAALARLEGAVAIGALVRRFPTMELAADRPDWNGRIILRGLDTLPVALGA
jgi:cytochrome P450